MASCRVLGLLALLCGKCLSNKPIPVSGDGRSLLSCAGPDSEDHPLLPSLITDLCATLGAMFLSTFSGDVKR